MLTIAEKLSRCAAHTNAPLCVPGGKMDALHGPSLAFEGARVLSLQEVGQFTCKGPMMTGTVYGRLNYRTAARTLFLRPYLAHFARFFAIFSRFSPS